MKKIAVRELPAIIHEANSVLRNSPEKKLGWHTQTPEKTAFIVALLEMVAQCLDSEKHVSKSDRLGRITVDFA